MKRFTALFANWTGSTSWPRNRIFLVTVAMAVSLSGLSGCNRPSEEECTKAVKNIRSLRGMNAASQGELASAIRTCRGNASRESVKCFINAEDAVALRDCEGDAYKKLYGDETKKDSGEPKKPEDSKTPAEPSKTK